MLANASREVVRVSAFFLQNIVDIMIATGRCWWPAQSVRVRQRIERWTTAGRPWALCRAAGHQLLELDSAACCTLQLQRAIVCYNCYLHSIEGALVQASSSSSLQALTEQ